MGQYVRLDLAFPRSGQKKMVYVPLQVAESVNGHREEMKPSRKEASHYSEVSMNHSAGDRNARI